MDQDVTEEIINSGQRSSSAAGRGRHGKVPGPGRRRDVGYRLSNGQQSGNEPVAQIDRGDLRNQEGSNFSSGPAYVRDDSHLDERRPNRNNQQIAGAYQVGDDNDLCACDAFEDWDGYGSPAGEIG